MDTALWVAIPSSIAAVIAAYFAYRGSTKASAVSERAHELQWVKEVREDAAAARRDLTAARAEAEQCRTQLATVRREATELADELHRMIRAIHDPYMSLDRLRVMVPFPPANGTKV